MSRWTTSQKAGVITGAVLLYVLIAIVAYGTGFGAGVLA